MEWLRYKIKDIVWRARFYLTPTKRLGNLLVKEIDKGLYCVGVIDDKQEDKQDGK